MRRRLANISYTVLKCYEEGEGDYLIKVGTDVQNFSKKPNAPAKRCPKT